MDLSLRKIDSADLSKKLQELGDLGVDVPMLNPSNCSPEYMGTIKGDVEVYRHRGVLVEVRRGEVIDSNGNVVHMRELEEKAEVLRTRIVKGRESLVSLSGTDYLNPLKINWPREREDPPKKLRDKRLYEDTLTAFPKRFQE